MTTPEILNDRMDRFFKNAVAFIAAKRAAGTDPTMTITPGTEEWNCWAAYFTERCGALPAVMRMVKRQQAASFMVPARLPEWFDPEYVPPARVPGDGADAEPKRRTTTPDEWSNYFVWLANAFNRANYRDRRDWTVANVQERLTEQERVGDGLVLLKKELEIAAKAKNMHRPHSLPWDRINRRPEAAE